MANLSMYGRNPLKSVTDYSREMATTNYIDSQTAQNQLAMQGTKLKNEQMARFQAEHDQMVNALRSGQFDPSTAEGMNKLQMAFPNTAPALVKQLTDNAHVLGQAEQSRSIADKNVIETRAKKMDYFASLIGRAGTDAQTGLGIVASAYQDPELGPMLTRDFGPMMQIMPHLQEKASTPEGWAQVQGPLAMGLKDYSEQQLKQQIANQPQIFSLDTGDNQVVAGFNKSTGCLPMPSRRVSARACNCRVKRKCVVKTWLTNAPVNLQYFASRNSTQARLTR
jgi:hypothetical protein